MTTANANLNDNTELRNTQIRLLNALKDICSRHKLTYWIDFGTLLGAHSFNNYFIPWDDDIDVSMPAEDYKKFLEIAERELPKDIFLQTQKTDPEYRNYFAKLRDCYSTLLEHRETGHEKYHQGIYIDIFPSVSYPKMPNLCRKLLIHLTLKSRENACVARKNIIWNYTIYYLCKSAWILLSMLPKAGVAQTPEDNGYKCVLPLSLIYPLGEIKFAGHFYPAPKKPHDYLKTMYKNYTANPPIASRVSHSKIILTNIPCKHPRALAKK